MSTGHYRPSPVGEADHPWLTKPDTKYNTEGVYKTGLILDAKEAEPMKAELQAAAEAALAEHIEKKGIKGAEAKKWSLYVPFEDETDDDGNPTGRVKFMFKQNAKIKLSDGSEKKVTIGIRDAKDKTINGISIFDGTKLRVMYKPRPIVVAGQKMAGVKLDFSMVQIIELAKSGGSKGFGAVEGGYSHDDDAPTKSDEGSEDAEY